MEKYYEKTYEIITVIDEIGTKMELVTEEVLKEWGILIKIEEERGGTLLQEKLKKVMKLIEQKCQKIKDQLGETAIEPAESHVCVAQEKELAKKNAVTRLDSYKDDMNREELSDRTKEKYMADVMCWLREMPEIITKADVLAYKEKISGTCKVTSVNSKIISINRYLKWLGYEELRVKTKKKQNRNGLENVITKENYLKMLQYAKKQKKRKMYYIMKTIAQTGIRIGELQFVTVEAIKEGNTIVRNKGKYRTVYFTERLCQELLRYCKKYNIKSGVIFSGREKGKAITPGAVWKGLKYIAKQVGIPENTVFPHSFRHLFAKEYMRKIGDISELADLLGHSRLETTWIYTKTTSEEKRKKLERIGL